MQCLKQVNMELLGLMCTLVGPTDPSCSGTLPCTPSTILSLALVGPSEISLKRSEMYTNFPNFSLFVQDYSLIKNKSGGVP